MKLTMRPTRRRFLAMSAALACAPRGAAAQHWQGRAFGAEISITVRGAEARAAQVLHNARRLIFDIEQLFSLYDPRSALSRLNQKGELHAPDPRFLALMEAADRSFHLTNGLFDPTVQSLWQARARGLDPAQQGARVGWDRLRFDREKITLGGGQALTFNGIAQGFATDAVSQLFEAHGFDDILVNIGEHRANGGPWTLALEDPEHGVLGLRRLTRGAIATSSPRALELANGGHILHPVRAAQWSTVSVEARSATLADSLSTGLVLARRDEIAALRARVDVSRITLVDWNGDLTTL